MRLINHFLDEPVPVHRLNRGLAKSDPVNLSMDRQVSYRLPVSRQVSHSAENTEAFPGATMPIAKRVVFYILQSLQHFIHLYSTCPSYKTYSISQQDRTQGAHGEDLSFQSLKKARTAKARTTGPAVTICSFLFLQSGVPASPARPIYQEQDHFTIWIYNVLC